MHTLGCRPNTHPQASFFVHFWCLFSFFLLSSWRLLCSSHFNQLAISQVNRKVRVLIAERFKICFLKKINILAPRLLKVLALLSMPAALFI